MEPSRLAYRNRFVHLTAAIGCLVMFAVWSGSLGGVIDGGLIQTKIFSAFVLFFVVPLGLYMGFLVFNRTPVFALRGDDLELSSSVFPWRKIVLHREDIESVTTNYYPESTKCDLVIVLADHAQPNLQRAKLWLKAKGRECYFSLLNTTISPPEAEEAVAQWLRESDG